MRKNVLIFGVGSLQRSIIETAKKKGFTTIGIDPNPVAECRENVDFFEIVNPDDFEKTKEIATKYKVDGIVTAATDKPLIMMARVAEEFNFPFFSVNTAERSTDKLKMKQTFIENSIPCASGIEINKANEYIGGFPVIIKPRDNSGSRGVIYCKNENELRNSFLDVKTHTRKETILVEEFIHGREFSVESFHNEDVHSVIQITEKETTPFPYNVELSHIQPANIDEQTRSNIENIIEKIGESFQFNHCPSHTELKISKNGAITVIETSPRLGGDFITSHLVPLSTGIDMESLLLDIAVGKKMTEKEILPRASMVNFFNIEQKDLTEKFLENIATLRTGKIVEDIYFSKSVGEILPKITNSLDRYGYFIISAADGEKLKEKKEQILQFLIA